jgi:hypothetical protein
MDFIINMIKFTAIFYKPLHQATKIYVFTGKTQLQRNNF